MLSHWTHQSIMGAVTPPGFQLVLYDLMDKGLLQGTRTKYSDLTVGQMIDSLSWMAGNTMKKLRRGMIDSRKAFMAMKYGDKHLDETL